MQLLVVLTLFCLTLAGCSSWRFGEDDQELIDRAPAAESPYPVAAFSNRLKPFTSNGCSKFPSGIDYPNEYKWTLCCVQHDLAYWKGGTIEDRNDADKQLRQCVIEQGEPSTAGIVYLNARNGDTDWGKHKDQWGYGWKLNRGYNPFTPQEKAELEKHEKNIPADYAQIKLRPAPPLSIVKSDSLTGNFCFDGALTFIHHHLRRTLKPMRVEQGTERDGAGFEQYLRLYDEHSSAPFEFKFYMNRENACTQPPALRSNATRIELKSFSYPLND